MILEKKNTEREREMAHSCPGRCAGTYSYSRPTMPVGRGITNGALGVPPPPPISFFPFANSELGIRILQSGSELRERSTNISSLLGS